MKKNKKPTPIVKLTNNNNKFKNSINKNNNKSKFNNNHDNKNILNNNKNNKFNKNQNNNNKRKYNQFKSNEEAEEDYKEDDDEELDFKNKNFKNNYRELEYDEDEEELEEEEEEEELPEKKEFTIKLSPFDFSKHKDLWFKFEKRFIQNTDIKIKESFDITLEQNKSILGDDDEEDSTSTTTTISTSLLPISKTFNSECLPESVSKYLNSFKFKSPSQFQKYSWPSILSGCDLLGVSMPGSGKTLGYCAPIIPHVLDRIEKQTVFEGIGCSVMALILVPTRELALQVHQTLIPAEKLFGIRSMALYGGVVKQKQIDDLQSKEPHILVSTPGRLVELVHRDYICLAGVSLLVLDEADKMLSIGLLDQLEQIKSQIRSDSQNLLFSATFPESIQSISQSWLKSPRINLKIGTMELPNLQHIKQDIQYVAVHKKVRTLMKILESNPNEKTIVFFNKIKDLKQIDKLLLKSKIEHQIMFGAMDQGDRTNVLNKFKSATQRSQREVKVLLATDVIGRGIHAENVGIVVNYDFPYTLEQYCHRVGRTGRGGAPGTAYSFLCKGSPEFIHSVVKFIEDQNQQVSMPFKKLCNEKFKTNFEIKVSERTRKKKQKILNNNNNSSSSSSEDEDD
eukprot:gene6590-8157_t